MIRRKRAFDENGKHFQYIIAPQKLRGKILFKDFSANIHLDQCPDPER